MILRITVPVAMIMVGFRLPVPRSADVIVQKNFFHYRMFYLGTTFRHIPVTSGEGATSLVAARARFEAKMARSRWTSTWSSVVELS